MKKVIFASGVAVLALAMVASAQGYSFQNNLTVGSTGADVSALQSFLISSGFHIPAVESGAAAKGYFGSQTKTAVVAYQKANGIPGTGFVGPLTKAALNQGTVSLPGNSVSVPCPTGFICTPSTPGSTPSTPAGPVGISTPGVPGTLAVSVWNSPSNGTTVYKGQSYDVAAYKLQASASDMAVQSISLDFSTRPWLYAGTITIKDDQGNTVAQVNNLNSSNFSELTVGTDYRITIPVTNYVVKAAMTRYLTVNVGFLAVSDRANGPISITQAQVRSVDGTGVTDTETKGDTTYAYSSGTSGCYNSAATAQNSDCRYFNYQGNGAGQVVVTLDASSPLAGLVQISTGATTNNVPLAVYDLKSQSAPGTLRSITLTVYTTGGKTPEQLFQQYNLKIGSQTIGANNVTANSTVGGTSSSTITFTNFGGINLAADTNVPVTLYANVMQDTNSALDGVSASTTLVASGAANGSNNNPDVEDQSYSQLAVNSNTLASSNLTFSGASATLSNLTATPGASITCASGSTSVNCGINMTFGFTLTAGNSSLYLSADPNMALSTSTSGLTPAASATSSLQIGGVTANPGQLAGDTNVNSTSGWYVIPAGSSRQFTYVGAMTGNAGGNTLRTFSITAVKYGTTTTSLAAGTINYNLQSLKVSSTF